MLVSLPINVPAVGLSKVPVMLTSEISAAHRKLKRTF
jgi:hypothetical protein